MSLDSSLVSAVRSRLYSGVLSDVLDDLGNWDHCLPPSIRPLDDALIMFGQARTGLFANVFGVDPGENPYALEIAMIDSLGPGDVAVVSCPPGDRVAPWGELLSTASRARGAVGCITDGLVRDVRFIRSLEFPVFAGGIAPLNSRGRGLLIKRDVPVQCGGVAISPGDWIFGDVDGVVVVPQDIAEKALTLALERVTHEGSVRSELESGSLLADVYARHGVL